MLEKPAVNDERIIQCLQGEYGLNVEEISFLPLGADVNTAVYRIVTADEKEYFLKLRSGEFIAATVEVPKYLSELGIKQVIPPLITATGRLYTELEPFKAILYPYVEGHDSFEGRLSEQQWIEFGVALNRFHTAAIPHAITRNIPAEDFSPKWRDILRLFMARIEKDTFEEPVAVEMAAFLKSKGKETRELVNRAEQLAKVLQQKPLQYILCHADIHGWNLFIDNNGALYMVDWDTLLFAPKERDLMFIGAGLGSSGYSPSEEETLFYQGYGHTNIDHTAIAYYRYERIIEDIAVYCEQIFLSVEGGKDRHQSLEYLKSNFMPASTIERAYQADKLLRSN